VWSKSSWKKEKKEPEEEEEKKVGKFKEE